MQHKINFYLIVLLSLQMLLNNCNQIHANELPSNETKNNTAEIINTDGKNLHERINVPKGFKRIENPQNSFTHFLRKLPLKPHGSKVKYYNGEFKNKENVYVAVIDKNIGTKDLHQCADAIIRLRADYLYEQKRLDEIHFNFTNGFNAKYSKWMEGFRIKVTGNNVEWVKTATPSNTYGTYWKYLETVFMYAGTLSLSKELKPKNIINITSGDVFIQGGSPGHAVIVADVAENEQGEKIFLLAQSYMPAQELQILINPQNPEISPWYKIPKDILITPEWQFNSTDLKIFQVKF